MLSEFKLGLVIRCLHCPNSAYDMFYLSDLPPSAVSGIAAKWKCLRTTETQP